MTAPTPEARSASGTASPDGVTAPDPRRWQILVILCAIQFMILLDMTVVNVALPRIQASLGFSTTGLAWVVNAYVLAAGGLLMLGGRLADVFGRRRLVLAGITLFGVSSLVAGAAVSPEMMIVGRFGQGAAEAIAAPASLGLIALLFPDPVERTKALGAWGGIIALGGTLGYIVSGVLTDLANWRWIFFINIPVTLVALVLIPRMVRESRMRRSRPGGLDVAGALTLTTGLGAVVYGLLHAAEHPWSDTTVLAPLLAGIGLLVAFVVIEARSSSPLVPLSFFANRTRSAVNFATIFFMAAFISYTFMLTLYMQNVLGFSPLLGGLAWLPLSVGIGVGIGVGTSAMPRVGVRIVTGVGFIGGGAGLLLSSRLAADSPYWWHVLPAMLVFGFFAGATMPAATNAALHEVTAEDASLASGVQTTAQQIGAALGVAVLVTLAVKTARDAVASGSAEGVALTEGFTQAFAVGGLLMIAGGAIVLALLERVTTEARDPVAESVAGPSAADVGNPS